MPITTPDGLVAGYANDGEHFAHVLDQLFQPAITAAGFEPVRPAATGSAVIHEHIISSLQEADLVLCDLSTKNPNVLFELGAGRRLTSRWR